MFDNVHFTTSKLDIPVTDKNYERAFPMLSIISNDSFDFLSAGTCIVDGAIKVCSLRPYTVFAQSNLFFIQSFSIHEAGKQYFTKRENMDSYLLLFTYAGEGYLEYEGQSFTLSMGDGFLIDCKKPHFYKTMGSNWTHADLHFSGALSSYFFENFGIENNYIFSQPTTGTFQTQFERLIELYDDVAPHRELLVSNALENLLIILLTESPVYKQTVKNLPENIKYLVRHIQNNYMNHLTLEYMSELSGISKYHLIRLFNKYLGYSPKEYVIQLQIENAKRMLETTTLPANTIGIMVGIENESYFGHLFKKRVGMSPGQYRSKV